MTEGKKMVWGKVDPYSVDLEYYSLKSLQEELSRWIRDYGEDARLERIDNEYDDGYAYYITKLREETDQEYKLRIKQEENWRIYTEEKDRRDFERLRLKYGI